MPSSSSWPKINHSINIWENVICLIEGHDVRHAKVDDLKKNNLGRLESDQLLRKLSKKLSKLFRL